MRKNKERKQETTRLPNIKIRHTAGELNFLTELLQRENPKTIVEIGTGRGGLTILFGSWTTKHGGKTVSIDIADSIKNMFHRKILENLNVELIMSNAWKPNTVNRIQKKLESPAFIYCDGGNKNLDLDTYAPLLTELDVIAAHDTETDTAYAKISKVAEKHGLTEVGRHKKITVWKKIKE